jgi:uncharacterized protein YcbK (DUF882 family)
MGDLSPHFNRAEFECNPEKCGCGFDDVDPALIDALEQIRSHFDQPVTVTSGCRCEAHNAACGGGKQSQHLYGKAADIVVKYTSPADVAAFAEELELGGVGRYESWTHVDVRDGYARWGSN